MIAVDITAAYTNPPLIPIGFKAEIVAAPGLSAASVDDIQWGLESTDTSTNGDYTVTIQTYLGVPVDAMDNPIGSARVYMRLVTSTYAGNPTPGNELSLTWV